LPLDVRFFRLGALLTGGHENHRKSGNKYKNIKEKSEEKSDERVPMYDAWYFVHTFPSMVLWRSALRALRASFSAARAKFIFFRADLVGEGPVTAAMGRASTAT